MPILPAMDAEMRTRLMAIINEAMAAPGSEIEAVTRPDARVLAPDEAYARGLDLATRHYEDTGHREITVTIKWIDAAKAGRLLS